MLLFTDKDTRIVAYIIKIRIGISFIVLYVKTTAAYSFSLFTKLFTDTFCILVSLQTVRAVAAVLFDLSLQIHNKLSVRVLLDNHCLFSPRDSACTCHMYYKN